MISVLSSVAAVGRALFAAIPSAQPSSFIIIVTGITLGTGAGGITGMTAALISGFWLGIGPWTPMQMLAWGLMGFFAGLLRKTIAQKKALRIIYGAAWGYLFGWIMNLWMILTVDTAESGWGYIISVYAASFLFDTIHAVSNMILLWLGGNKFIKTMGRLAVKYGITR